MLVTLKLIRTVQYYWFTNILQYFGFQYVLQYVFPYCNNIVFYPLFPLILNLFELNIFSLEIHNDCN